MSGVLEDFPSRAFCEQLFIDADRIYSAIELTRFPVPKDEDYKETDTEAARLRAAEPDRSTR
jgi:hypothetical protein